MIVTAHAPNFLPGLSVLGKIQAADALIVCDLAQYDRHGYCNRNRLAPDGPWLTVPVDDRDTYQPLSRVRIAHGAGDRWRRKLAKTLELHLGDAAEPYVAEIHRPYRLLVGLNVALLRHLCDDLGCHATWVMQSHLLGGTEQLHLPARNGDLRPHASEWIARMVSELAGNTFLSGPSGRTYLDETPFHERGITVRYWQHDGPNPSAITLLANHDLAAA
jgi:hypothetical protein